MILEVTVRITTAPAPNMEDWDEAWVADERRGVCVCANVEAQAHMTKTPYGSYADNKPVSATVSNVPVYGDGDTDYVRDAVQLLREFLVADGYLTPGDDIPAEKVVFDLAG